jgi:hypothetical protein
MARARVPRDASSTWTGPLYALAVSEVDVHELLREVVLRRPADGGDHGHLVVARESGNLIDHTKDDDEMPEVEKEEF